MEAYPIAYYRNGGGIDDANASDRAVYEEGYDQAMQDFFEKAEKFFKSMYETMEKPNLGDKTIELFKNYIR